MVDVGSHEQAAPGAAPGRVSSPGGRAAVARSALHLVLGQVATTALSIVLSAELGRGLGAGDFGLWFFLMNSTTFAYTVVDWGGQTLIMREVAKDHSRAASLLGTSIVMRSALAVIAGAIATATVASLGYDRTTQLLTAAAVALWLPTFLTQTYGLVFRGLERMELDARATVLGKALHVTMVVPALALGGGLKAVLASLGAAGAGSLAYAAASARKAGIGRPRLDRSEMRGLLVEGGPLVLMSLLFIAQNYGETLLISRFCPAPVLGWYGAAKTISNTLVMPASILMTATFPRLSRSASDPMAFRAEVSAALRPVHAMAVLVAVGTYLFAHVAIGLVYGLDGFGNAVVILQAIGATLFFILIDIGLGTVLVAAGKQRVIAAYKVLVLGISMALAVVWVPLAQERFANGALGSLAAYCVSEVVMMIIFVKLLPKGALDRRLGLDLGRAVLSGVVAWGAVTVMPWKSPFLGIPLCIAAFGAAAFLTRLLRKEDAGFLVEAVRRKTRRA